MSGLLGPALVAVALAQAPASAPDRPAATRILILQSFSRDFAPYSVLSSSFKSELVRGSTGPLQFYEIPLDATRLHPTEDQDPFVNFLVTRFAQHPPALMVPIGRPAALFALKNRQRLFPASPMLLAGTEERHLNVLSLGARDFSVPIAIDLARLIDNILQVLPETTNIMIVLGSSPLELFWGNEFQTEQKRLGDRVTFTWCNHLSLQQVCQKAASLPARSAILYALMIVDAAGVPHEQDAALTTITQSAQAPVFGVFEDQLGLGIVGGPLLSTERTGRQAAQTGLALLKGQTAGTVYQKAIELNPPVFDWRQLRRWGIPETRLPANAAIRFKPPSQWEKYRSLILGVASILGLQTALIISLLLQRTRRRRAERDSRSLAGRLLTAQEDERRRLARELHDDLTQRLARLTIDVARMEQSLSGSTQTNPGAAIRDELVRLCEDVHALSYRLHPSMLDDLGLLDALKAECKSFWQREAIPVHVHAEEMSSPVPRGVALCLYRIAQEALRNVARHAHARTVDVSLRQLDGGLHLAVSDDGDGFNPQESGTRPSLGHASMRERVLLVGGELDIESARGCGSTISAWVPLNGASV